MSQAPLMRCRVAVPATCANLGPGFDVLALALELQNEVTVEQTGRPGIDLDCGPGAPAELSDPARNLVCIAYSGASEAMGRRGDRVSIRCVNRIPLRRGLGGSAAAAVGGVLAAVALHRANWDERRILDACVALEGHADNAAAALLGGLAIVAPGIAPVTMAVSDEILVVLFIPDVELSTSEARTVVPDLYSRADAVHNTGRVALLIRAVAERDWDALGEAMEDRFHQPQRTALMPWLPDLILAARGAGAVGACLSGAGPSVLALTWRDPKRVQAGLMAAARRHGLRGRTVISRVRNYGSRVDSGMVA